MYKRQVPTKNLSVKKHVKQEEPKPCVFRSIKRKGINTDHRKKPKKINKRIDPYVVRFIDKCNSIGTCKTSICQLPYIQIDLGATNTLGLIDSGSTRSLISQQLATVLANHNLIRRSQNVNIKSVLPRIRKT